MKLPVILFGLLSFHLTAGPAVEVVGENGVTLITPGMKLAAKDGKMLPVEAPEPVKLLIRFNELDSLEERWSVKKVPAGD